MKAAASLFFTCLMLSFALIWQAGCNPDLGLQDPLRPRAEVQVLRFTPDVISPTEVRTGGTQTVTSADGTTVTSRPITTVLFPDPTVEFRLNNGVSALITGYSVVYTFARPGNPNTGLALFGGPLNVFIDAAPIISTNGGALAESDGGPIGGRLPKPPQADLGGFSITGRVSFGLPVLSPEARDFLVPASGPPNPNAISCNITFFVEDINGHSYTVQARIPANSLQKVSTGN